MSGVNLRVATLKNANLQNCDLRTAVLAGADLEVCSKAYTNMYISKRTNCKNIRNIVHRGDFGY